MSKPKYIVYQWRGRTVRRLRETQAQKDARVKRMIASKAEARHGRPAGSAAVSQRAPAAGQPGRANGDAQTLGARVNDALILLQEGEAWLGMRYGQHVLAKMDFAHLRMAMARAALLGDGKLPQ
jgi:hypothetical protein